MSLSLIAVLAVLPAPSGSASATGPSPHQWGATARSACDPLDTRLCMLPFPNDYYTDPDGGRTTGRAVYFPPTAFPIRANASGPVDPEAWEGNDGFSPGSNILVHVPGIDLAASHVATISDMVDSLSAGDPIVLVDATTGQRWPTWAELDASDPNPSSQLLIIHPARNLAEGHRYLVALRDLKRADGSSIVPNSFFASVLSSSSLTSDGIHAAYATHL